jgi:hypothetical protein
MANGKKKPNGLTPKEQKSTATFKLMTEGKKALEKSLQRTQDELEKYREKYYEEHENHAIQKSKNSTLIFHEILKFGVSLLFGGVGVNLITDQSYLKGFGLVGIGMLLYGLIVFFDRK